MVKSIMTATVVSIIMLFAVNTYAYSDDVFSSLEMEQADGAYTNTGHIRPQTLPCCGLKASGAMS